MLLQKQTQIKRMGICFKKGKGSYGVHKQDNKFQTPVGPSLKKRELPPAKDTFFPVHTQIKISGYIQKLPRWKNLKVQSANRPIEIRCWQEFSA
jgi:hypothetical protein